MKSRLSARFERDDGESGELFVEVSARGFAGVSSAWFDAKQLASFAETLVRTYPLSSTEPVSLKGGYWDKPGKVVVAVHVGLSFYAVGSRGRVACKVQLSSPEYVENDSEREARLELELDTTYEEVRGFAMAISAVARGEIKEALLECAEG